jgi:hypothetical protein
MKKHNFLIALASLTLLFASSAATAQTADSTASRFVRKEQLVDKDGDGIPDSAGAQGHRIRRGKDRFIDKDGDGICDGREGGLGLRYRGGANGRKSGNAGPKGGNR